MGDTFSLWQRSCGSFSSPYRWRPETQRCQVHVHSHTGSPSWYWMTTFHPVLLWYRAHRCLSRSPISPLETSKNTPVPCVPMFSRVCFPLPKDSDILSFPFIVRVRTPISLPGSCTEDCCVSPAGPRVAVQGQIRHLSICSISKEYSMPTLHVARGR